MSRIKLKEVYGELKQLETWPYVFDDWSFTLLYENFISKFRCVNVSNICTNDFNLQFFQTKSFLN